MIANFDYYNRFEQPIISLRSPNDKFMGFVDNIKNLNINPEFNAVSEMTCDIYKYGDDNVELKIYDDIKVKRQLFVEDVGFFIITEVEENDSEEGIYKSLTLYSCEHEMSYKKLTYFNGTYKFWDEDNPSDTLMGIILKSLPRWSIGHVDSSIATLHRTFEEPDTTIFAFLMEDVEDSYGCLFDFDIINRVINVYDKNNYINKTTILLSRKDVIDSIKVNTKSEEIYTALTLYGDDEITYSGINPLGTSTVYNFNYYKEWMSDELKAALNTWELNVAHAETSITTLRTSLSNIITELQTIQGEIDSINEQITLLEKQLGVNTLDENMVSDLISQINNKKADLIIAQTNYNNKSAEKDTISENLNNIYASCSFENNFTEEQMQELDAYIYEGSDVDDTFAFTDDMSYEKQEQILVGLYNKAKSMLSDISVPTEELTLDTNNFIFQKEFLPYTQQLNTGVIVDVEIKDDVIVSYVLLKMEVNYQDKTINLTFGNKYRSSTAEKLWSDWESKVSKSSTTLTYERSKYGKAVNSGSLDKMNAFMKSSLDLTLNQVKSSDGQSIEITDSGLKARRIDPSDKTIDSEQLWLTSNNIVFTDDNWNTIKTAIGRLNLPNGTEGYGINAEYLIGKMILAEGMEITNKGGSFIIDENGVQIKFNDKIQNIEEIAVLNLIDLIVSSPVFTLDNEKNTYSPNVITIAPVFTNCEYSKWQYSIDGGDNWIDIKNISGISVDKITSALSIQNDCELYTDTNNVVNFKIIGKCKDSKGNYNDVAHANTSIFRVKEGNSITSLITSSEGESFKTDNLPTSTTLTCHVYKNGEEITTKSYQWLQLADDDETWTEIGTEKSISILLESFNIKNRIKCKFEI